MALIDNVIAWCKQELEMNQKLLEQLTSGAMRMFAQHGSSPKIETTATDVIEAKRKIAELEALLAGYAEKG